MKRPGLRKWAKWACTLAAGALLGVWVVSVLWRCKHDNLTGDGHTFWSAGIDGGSAWVGKWDGWLAGGVKVSPGWRLQRNDLGTWGYWTDFLGGAGGLRWFPGIHYDQAPAGWMLTIDLLYPLLCVAIPAAWLWYADRRRLRPGACGGCGYDRAGLAAAVKCPECGTVPTVGGGRCGGG